MLFLHVLPKRSPTPHLSSAVLPRRGRVRVAATSSPCLEGGQVGGRAGVGQAQVLGLHACHLGAREVREVREVKGSMIIP